MLLSYDLVALTAVDRPLDGRTEQNVSILHDADIEDSFIKLSLKIGFTLHDGTFVSERLCPWRDGRFIESVNIGGSYTHSPKTRPFIVPHPETFDLSSISASIMNSVNQSPTRKSGYICQCPWLSFLANDRVVSHHTPE
jgi:hypothetical protein